MVVRCARQVFSPYHVGARHRAIVVARGVRSSGPSDVQRRPGARHLELVRAGVGRRDSRSQRGGRHLVRRRETSVCCRRRRTAATFGRWVSLTQATDNRLGTSLPPGFAHSVYTLSDLADIMYKLTQEYSPSHEAGIVSNDPDVGIVWPVTHPTVSARDAAFPRLRDADPAF